MIYKAISVYFLVYFVSCTLSTAVENDAKELTLWLPKCCPEEKVISSDGKSCVRDPTLNLLYDVSSEDVFSPPDVLTVVRNNRSAQYKLLYKTQFNCVRHELYVVNNDIYVTPENDVVVYDGYGQNWTLATPEMCVDSVVFSPSPELRPTRIFVALLCPSCQNTVCLHKCCKESERLLVNEDATKVDCIASSGPSWSQQLSSKFNANTLIQY